MHIFTNLHIFSLATYGLKSQLHASRNFFTQDLFFLKTQSLIVRIVEYSMSAQAVLALPEDALGWDDTHQLQKGDGGHHDGHLLGG